MLRVSDIMTPEVVTASPELSVRDAMGLLTSQHISGMPVVEGERVVGVVSITDLASLAAELPGTPSSREPLMELGEEPEPEVDELPDEPPASFFTDLWDDAGADLVVRTETTGTPEWNALEEHTVGEVMSRILHWLPPDADVPRAAEYMQHRGIHRLLVMEDGHLRGIVTTADVARAVAEHRLSERHFVFGKPQVRPDRSWW